MSESRSAEAAGGTRSGATMRQYREFARQSAENLQRERLRFEHELKLSERGWVGRIFGSSAEKIGNIAGLALILFILLFALVLFFFTDPSPTQPISRKEALAIVGGFITLTLGYVFGKSSSGS